MPRRDLPMYAYAVWSDKCSSLFPTSLGYDHHSIKMEPQRQRQFSDIHNPLWNRTLNAIPDSPGGDGCEEFDWSSPISVDAWVFGTATDLYDEGFMPTI